MMNRKPFFSVVIPTYNRVRYLMRAIQSVQNQSFSDYEIVVVDNASTDETRTAVVSMHDRNIKYFRQRHLVSVQQNIQTGIDRARGSYIFLLGDDDLLIRRNTLSRVYELCKKGSYGIVRLNYLSVLPESGDIFDFRASKHLYADATLLAHSTSAEILKFIIEMDPSFLSGLIMRNEIPENAKVLDSELVSWFPILYSLSAAYGAQYVSTPYILATWSQWRPAKNQRHSLYSLKKGTLSAEAYYGEVSKLCDHVTYRKFLQTQVMGTYVRMFPAAKFFTGNRNLIQLARRILLLVPEFRKSVRFWMYLIVSLMAPSGILGRMKTKLLELQVQRNHVRSKEFSHEYLALTSI